MNDRTRIPKEQCGYVSYLKSGIFWVVKRGNADFEAFDATPENYQWLWSTFGNWTIAKLEGHGFISFRLINPEKPEKSPDLKLYVWDEVLCDYTCGVMFALAHTVEEAREKIREEWLGASGSEELEAEPEVYAAPVGFAIWGGG